MIGSAHDAPLPWLQHPSTARSRSRSLAPYFFNNLLKPSRYDDPKNGL
jgi:hypothetical protein